MERPSAPFSRTGAIRNGGFLDRRNNFDLLRLVAATSVIFSHAFLLAEGKQDNEPLCRLTGGQSVLGSFLDAGAIDEVHVAVSPRLLGGRTAKVPFGAEGFATLKEALTLAEWRAEVVGDNLYLHGTRA